MTTVALDYLNQDELLHVGMLQVLLRGTAEVCHEGVDGVFLRDTVSNAWMLSAKNPRTGLWWLREQEHRGYHLMQLCQRELADYAQKEYGLQTRLACRNAVYRGSRPPKSQSRLQIREAKTEDIAAIRANYAKLSGEELEEISRRHNLFAGYFENQFVGFIGSHLEGSIGLLEVLPRHRNQGFGTELEYYMIGRMLQKGLIPFGQIETWNEKSLRLQKKLGMELSPEAEPVFWLFG